jgi:hypothetical protein
MVLMLNGIVKDSTATGNDKPGGFVYTHPLTHQVRKYTVSAHHVTDEVALLFGSKTFANKCLRLAELLSVGLQFHPNETETVLAAAEPLFDELAERLPALASYAVMVRERTMWWMGARIR